MPATCLILLQGLGIYLEDVNVMVLPPWDIRLSSGYSKSRVWVGCVPITPGGQGQLSTPAESYELSVEKRSSMLLTDAHDQCVYSH